MLHRTHLKTHMRQTDSPMPGEDVRAVSLRSAGGNVKWHIHLEDSMIVS